MPGSSLGGGTGINRQDFRAWPVSWGSEKISGPRLGILSELDPLG